MYKKFFLMTILLSIAVAAMSQKNISKGKIIYSGTRLTYPLLEGWVKEFNKLHPSIAVSLLSRGDSISEPDLKILAYDLRNEMLKPGETYVSVARYAQLPVANKNNPLLQDWKRHGIGKQELKDLYFKTTDQDKKEEKPSHHMVTIYTRQTPACATKAFAGHFNSDVTQSKGVGVKGDDQTLLEAVKKDTHGVSYNNLGFIYQLKTREVAEGIAVIPMDFNNNGKIDTEENFYDHLDKVISRLESFNNQEIAIENVNFVYQKDFSNPAVESFIQWVLSSKGQELTHVYGFLKNTEENKTYTSNKH